MRIIPAIDILGGRVVRLFQGKYSDKREYSDDPLSVAQRWHDQGARYLHIVDLDGAKDGAPKNMGIIEKIVTTIPIPIEVGGGIRTPEHIAKYLSFGTDKVVLGSAVLHDLSFLEQKQVQEHIKKIVLSFDAVREDDDVLPIIKAGTSGWHKEVPIMDHGGLIERFVSAGIQHLNYTDRSKDGTLAGLSDSDIEGLLSFLDAIKSTAFNVVYAGGIASLGDLKKLATLKNDKLSGVIIGMALYENRFSLKGAHEAANVS